MIVHQALKMPYHQDGHRTGSPSTSRTSCQRIRPPHGPLNHVPLDQMGLIDRGPVGRAHEDSNHIEVN